MLNAHIPMTASWSTVLPDSHARIGISRGRPRRQSGYRIYSALAPGEWWNKVDIREFHALYMRQLSFLDPAEGLSDLHDLAGDRIPTLLCFERLAETESYCHRAFVADWFKTSLDVDVGEFGAEPNCVGCFHPKFPPDLRPNAD